MYPTHHEVIAALLCIYRWMMRLLSVVGVRVPKTGVVSTNFLQLARRIYLRTCGDETYVQPPNITHCSTLPIKLWWIGTRIVQVFKAIQIYVTQKKHRYFAILSIQVSKKKIGTLSDYGVFLVVEQSPGSAISLPGIIQFIWINLSVH